MRLNEDRLVEGDRLALTTCQETPNKHLFMKYLNMFIKADKFSLGMALLADRIFDLNWFKNPFPGGSPQAAAQSNVIWKAFLTLTLLSYIIETWSKGYNFMSYQPNLVAHQFGLSQMTLKPLVSHVIYIVWSGRSLNADDHKACLRFANLPNHMNFLCSNFNNPFLQQLILTNGGKPTRVTPFLVTNFFRI